MKKGALSILLALLLTLTACATTASAPQARAAGSSSIQSLALEPGEDTARVTLTVAEESALLVAVYDMDQKMVSLGGSRVTPGESPVSVPLTAPAPQQFRARAFLLSGSLTPACESVLLDPAEDGPEISDQEEPNMNQITLTFNGHTYPATLADNSSAQAFAQMIRDNGGAMTVHMNEYGGWEKVGPLGRTLPSSDVQTTTAPGDFVLYSSNQIVLFYGSNSWAYTRLGRVDDPAGLKEALGDGDVDITFQLAS